MMSQLRPQLPALAVCALMWAVTASANPVESTADPGPPACPTRAAGTEPEAESDARKATGSPGDGPRSRLSTPPGMNPRWHRFLPGMFR